MKVCIIGNKNLEKVKIFEKMLSTFNDIVNEKDSEIIFSFDEKFKNNDINIPLIFCEIKEENIKENKNIFIMPVNNNFYKNKAIILGFDKNTYNIVHYKNIESILIAAKNRKLINCEGIFSTSFLNAKTYFLFFDDIESYINKNLSLIKDCSLDMCTNYDEFKEMIYINL